LAIALLAAFSLAGRCRYSARQRGCKQLTAVLLTLAMIGRVDSAWRGVRFGRTGDGFVPREAWRGAGSGLVQVLVMTSEIVTPRGIRRVN